MRTILIDDLYSAFAFTVWNRTLSASSPSTQQQRRGYWLRTLHQWHRISAAVCLIGMLLFAVTGITLNHAAQIEAMRSGRLHIAAFSPGPVNFAVNLAGAVPFAIRGNDQGPVGMNLKMIVRKESSFQKLEDLKGKRIAHTSPSSNSGNLAPRALFPKIGLTPDTDYKVVYSGKHDQSILGVKTGDYDAAPVASDVLQHIADRGVVKMDDFRTLYTSEMFPTDAYANAYNLEPALQTKIKQCFYDYKVPAEMAKGLGGDRFLPITYQKDWELVRTVAASAGELFTREAFDKAAAGKK